MLGRTQLDGGRREEDGEGDVQACLGKDGRMQVTTERVLLRQESSERSQRPEQEGRTLMLVPLLSTVNSPSGTSSSPLHSSVPSSSASTGTSSPVLRRTAAHSNSRPEFGFAMGAVRICRAMAPEGLSSLERRRCMAVGDDGRSRRR